MRIRRLLLLIIVLFSPVSSANVYKCKSDNGKVLFTDMPCNAAASTVNVSKKKHSHYHHQSSPIFDDLELKPSKEYEWMCERAYVFVNSYIADWYNFISKSKTMHQNPSVVAMYNDQKKGRLQDKFIKKCTVDWKYHSDTLRCLESSRTKVDGQVCLHQDKNLSRWQYY